MTTLTTSHNKTGCKPTNQQRKHSIRVLKLRRTNTLSRFFVVGYGRVLLFTTFFMNMLLKLYNILHIFSCEIWDNAIRIFFVIFLDHPWPIICTNRRINWNLFHFIAEIEKRTLLTYIGCIIIYYSWSFGRLASFITMLPMHTSDQCCFIKPKCVYKNL